MPKKPAPKKKLAKKNALATPPSKIITPEFKFDIRASADPADIPVYTLAHDQINLMSYVLDDFTYNQFMGPQGVGVPLKEVIGAVYNRLNQPNALRYLTNAVRDAMLPFLLHAYQNAPNSLLVYDLYRVQHPIGDKGIRDNVIEYLAAARNASSFRLCMPFLDFQQNGAIDDARKPETILPVYGNKRHVELFTTKLVGTSLRALAATLKKGGRIEPKGDGSKNNKACSNNVCVTAPNKYCAMLPDNSGCTAGSNPL